MIRHKLTAQKQLFIVILLINSVLLMGALKHAFEASGFLILTESARIEVYLIGVLAGLLFLRERWSNLLQGTVHPAPFEGVILAARFVFVQAFAFSLIYFLLQDIAVSRAFLIWFLAIGFPFNAALIIWLPGWFRKLFNRSKALTGILVGLGAIPEEAITYASHCRHFGVTFHDHYGDTQESEVPFNYRGEIAKFKDEAFSNDAAVDRVLFFGRKTDDPDYRAALELCHQSGIRAQVMLHEQELFGYLGRHVVDGNAHFLTMADEPLQNPLNRILKRAIDILLSLLVVIFLLPPLIVVVWLVQRWQSPGPLFFRQTRHGLGRQTFRILKFRTMQSSAASEALQAKAADPRIYPLGRILRRTSLDEIPQFINVLRGEMSVIGPRPHLTVHDDLFEEEVHAYRIRHFVKPGITGYAQIRGLRGEVTTTEQIHQRVQHDIHYISNWSLKLDFYILCKTVVTVLRPPESAV